MKTTTAVSAGFLFCSLVVAPSQESSESESKGSVTVTNRLPSVVQFEPMTTTNSVIELSETNNPFQRIPLSEEFSATLDVEELQIPEVLEPLDRIEGESTVIEGGLVPILKEPTGNSLFQLFNPFAPKEYGGTTHEPGSKAFSRAFHDPVASKPTWVLFSVGEKPEPVAGDLFLETTD